MSHNHPIALRASALATMMALPLLLGCSAEGSESAADDGTVEIPEVPVPPADGPRLTVVRDGTIVRDRPADSGLELGLLRMGAQVVRAVAPYSTRDCPGGWYPIRPRGFVCAGGDATIGPGHPVLEVADLAPNLDRPLPYRYGRVRRGAAVIYRAVPSALAQHSAEPQLRRRRPPKAQRLGAGSNDVPLDENGWPQGPPVLLPDAEGVGEDGYRMSHLYFQVPEATLPSALLGEGTLLQSTEEHAPYANAARALVPETQVFRKRSGVALVASFDVGDDEATRRFGLLPDGRFIPVDRLRPELGSTWHGADVRKSGLPVAFALRAGVRLRRVDGRRSTPIEDELEPRQPLELTGRYRTLRGRRHYRTAQGLWVRAKDIILVNKRDRFPDFAQIGQKWLDISLANQTLVAYEGRKALYATLISSGSDRLGDPASGPASRQGVFRIERKYVTAHIDGREAQQRHELLEAPWVMQYADGFALTGSYWIRRFGEALSYHNIALCPVDARLLFHWSDPQLPDHWHGVVAADGEASTIVYVHK